MGAEVYYTFYILLPAENRTETHICDTLNKWQNIEYLRLLQANNQRTLLTTITTYTAGCFLLSKD